MLKVVSVQNEKGGSGKTNTSVNLTTDLKRRDYKVAIVDNDPQNGSLRWKQAVAVPEDYPMIVPIENPLSRNDIEFAETLDFLIIDGAPGFGNDKRLKSCHDLLNELLLATDDEIAPDIKADMKKRVRKIFGFDGSITAKLSASIKLADLVIIPTIPSWQDVEPAINMIDSLLIPYREIHGKPDFKILLTSSSKTTDLYNSTKKSLNSRGIATFSNPIATREIYRKATTDGFTVLDDICKDKKAAAETRSITDQVLEYFNMPATKNKADV